VYNSGLYCMIFLGHKDDFIVFINGEEVYVGLKERSKTGPHKADIRKVSGYSIASCVAMHNSYHHSL